MVTGAFVFGMDEDDHSVFRSHRGVEHRERRRGRRRFHILTPYPGTALFPEDGGRRAHPAPRLGSLRHPSRRLPHTAHERRGARIGLWRAYQDFYRWGAIFRGRWTKETAGGRLRHVAYAGGWKKFEPLWDFVIKTRRICRLLARARERPVRVWPASCDGRRASRTEPSAVAARDVA